MRSDRKQMFRDEKRNWCASSLRVGAHGKPSSDVKANFWLSFVIHPFDGSVETVIRLSLEKFLLIPIDWLNLARPFVRLWYCAIFFSLHKIFCFLWTHAFEYGLWHGDRRLTRLIYPIHAGFDWHFVGVVFHFFDSWMLHPKSGWGWLALAKGIMMMFWWCYW